HCDLRGSIGDEERLYQDHRRARRHGDRDQYSRRIRGRRRARPHLSPGGYQRWNRLYGSTRCTAVSGKYGELTANRGLAPAMMNSPRKYLVMSAPIKDFSALKTLRKDLKAQEEARRAAEAERARRDQQAKHDADLFRRSVGDVAPLPSAN